MFKADVHSIEILETEEITLEDTDVTAGTEKGFWSLEENCIVQEDSGAGTEDIVVINDEKEEDRTSTEMETLPSLMFQLNV